MSFIFALQACRRQSPTSTPPASQAGPATDYQSLINKLRAEGLRVEAAADGDLAQPFFSVPARLVVVNGVTLQVFEYGSTAAADAESSRVNAQGTSVGTTMLTWVEPPHFYKSGKLIILFVGNDEHILKVLDRTLGAQFAGQ